MIPSASTWKGALKKPTKNGKTRRRKPEEGLRGRVQVLETTSRVDEDEISEHCWKTRRLLATIFGKTAALSPSTELLQTAFLTSGGLFLFCREPLEGVLLCCQSVLFAR